MTLEVPLFRARPPDSTAAERANTAAGPKGSSASFGLLAGGLGALVLLVLGEIAPALIPVRVMLEVHGTDVTITTDGGQHLVHRPTDIRWDHLQFEQPGPEDREVQIDGSETVGRGDREASYIRTLEANPLYIIGAWLRDESGFSRWENVRLFDAETGEVLADGRAAAEATTLPAAFRLQAAIRHPEAPARIWLTIRDQPFREGLQFERNAHSAAWVREPARGMEPVQWFFPVEPGPFAANLLQLAGRSCAAGYLLVLGILLLGWAAARAPGLLAATERVEVAAAKFLVPTLALASLVGSAWISVALYHQLPHMLDATNYYIQAGMFLSGHFWFEPPPLAKFFTLNNQVLWDHRWFVQYPPGAPAAYALGRVVGLAWLVGPLAAVVMVLCIAAAGKVWFGRSVALAALGLASLSPFVLFQAGTFMSHPLAGGALGAALAAFAKGERSGRFWPFAVAGACVGFGFLTREYSAVLFALPLGVWLALHRRPRALMLMLAASAPFLVAYFAYNGMVTRDPFVLPRSSVDASDHPGFGPGHTLALGLVFADQDLNALQFDLFGWPPLLGLSVMALPFALGKASRYDVLLASGALVIIAAFVPVPGHGIGAMGPRYYYEAVPWFVLLAARGLQAAVATARQLGLSTAAARAGAAVLVGSLTLYAFGFYVPRLVERRIDFAALGNGRRYTYPFIESTLTGPKLRGFDGPTVVLVGDEDIFKTISAMNCPLLDGTEAAACPVLFVHAGEDAVARVSEAYPGRSVVRAQGSNGVVSLTPVATRP